MSDSKDKTISSWPPKERPEQVTREQLSQMTPEAIEIARQAGALDDLLGRGVKPAPPEPPPIPPRSS